MSYTSADTISNPVYQKLRIFIHHTLNILTAILYIFSDFLLSSFCVCLFFFVCNNTEKVFLNIFWLQNKCFCHWYMHIISLFWIFRNRCDFYGKTTPTRGREEARFRFGFMRLADSMSFLVLVSAYIHIMYITKLLFWWK